MLQIKNIVTDKRGNGKSYNLDLYKSESELIEMADFISDKNKCIELYVIDTDSISDKRTGEVIGLREQFIMLHQDGDRLDDKYTTYIYNVTQQEGYNGELQTTVYRQQLQINGFTWLYKKGNDWAKLQEIDPENPKHQELYTQLSGKIIGTYNLLLIDAGIGASYEDLFEVAILNSYGSYSVELEGDNKKVKVKFDKDKLLSAIEVQEVKTVTKKSFKSVLGDTVEEELALSSEEIILKEEEETLRAEAKKAKKALKSALDS